MNGQLCVGGQKGESCSSQCGSLEGEALCGVKRGEGGLCCKGESMQTRGCY